MKQILTLTFCLVFLSSICTAQSSTCVTQTNPSGVITDSSSLKQYYEKCWKIKVPEGSYVRLAVKEINFGGHMCSNVYIKFTVFKRIEEYMFCSKTDIRMPITALNDVRITYYHNFSKPGYSTSFKLHYITGNVNCTDQTHFRCSADHCIHQDQVCDGVKDCKNGADEASCGSSNCTDQTLFQCSEDHCIHQDQVCDGVKDCKNGADEASCGSSNCADQTYFRCSEDHCILQDQVCDGVKDCKNGADETSCGSSNCTDKTHFRCSEDHCIHQDQVCDGVKDCKNGADEASCGVTAIKGVNISRENAITWLKERRSDCYGWGKNTHRAITALYLSGGATFRDGDLEENLIVKQLELQASVALLRSSSDPISVNELSMFINALSITCHNPRQFYGRDLVKILSERALTMNSAVPGAYLTLCNANWTFSDVEIRSLLDILSTNSGYPFHLDIQAMSVMALTCIKKKENSFYETENATEIYNATIKKFISRQRHDGSFGNVYTTAMVTQALLSSGQENNNNWNLTSTIKFLMRNLNSTSIDFLSVYFVAPIFNSKTLVDMGAVHCEKPRKECGGEEITDDSDKNRGKMHVKYYLQIGYRKDVTHSIFLRMPENSSAFDVMRVAQEADEKYRFRHTEMSGHVYVYEIAGITNDPEAGKFWLLFSKGSRGNGTLVHHIESPDEVFLSDGDHLVMWYKEAHL